MPSGATGLAVGVSGGADSACLLAAIAQLGTPCPIRGLNVRAVHIDHGLQPAAAALRAAGEALCRRMHIPLAVISVAVELARRCVDRGGGARGALSRARARARARRMPADRAPRAGPGRDAAAAAAARCRPQGPLLHAALPAARAGLAFAPAPQRRAAGCADFRPRSGNRRGRGSDESRSALRPRVSARAGVAAPREALAGCGHRAVANGASCGRGPGIIGRVGGAHGAAAARRRCARR